MAIGIRVETRKAERTFRRIGKAFNAKGMLLAIGARHLRWIDQNFRAEGLERKWKRLSPNTIAGRRGGSSKPLQDTGRLRQSFVQASPKLIGNDAVEVGTESKIAAFHQFGTKPAVIRPRKAGGVLRFLTPSGPRFAKIINHPGIPARPMLPTKSTGEALAVKVVRAAIDKAVRDAERGN